METLNAHLTVSDIRRLLDDVHDPEIPVISIADLGVLRDVQKVGEDFLIIITPTYSGCPATDMMKVGIFAKMKAAGIKNFHVETQLSPAWTTDWMSEDGKRKLKEFGIAPPMGNAGSEILEQEHPPCPHCFSLNTELVSQFGSTACKALFRCLSCGEPFDYFKCH